MGYSTATRPGKISRTAIRRSTEIRSPTTMALSLLFPRSRNTSGLTSSITKPTNAIHFFKSDRNASASPCYKLMNNGLLSLFNKVQASDGSCEVVNMGTRFMSLTRKLLVSLQPCCVEWSFHHLETSRWAVSVVSGCS